MPSNGGIHNRSKEYMGSARVSMISRAGVRAGVKRDNRELIRHDRVLEERLAIIYGRRVP